MIRIALLGTSMGINWNLKILVKVLIGRLIPQKLESWKLLEFTNTISLWVFTTTRKPWLCPQTYA